MKLLELKGSHYGTGYAYGKLMGKEVEESYRLFFGAAVKGELEMKIVELFLDWQY